MRNFLFTLTTAICLFTTQFSYAQQDINYSSIAPIQASAYLAPAPLLAVHSMARPSAVRPVPIFSDEHTTFNSFFQAHVSYPAVAQENNIEGMILVDLYINSYGEIQDTRIVESLFGPLDLAVIDAAKQLPLLEPALLNGSPISRVVRVPLAFSLR